MITQNNLSCSYKIKRDFDSNTNKEIKYLKINCEKCKYFYHNQENKLFNSQCFKNIVKLFLDNPALNKVTMETIYGEIEFTNTQIELISDYTNQLTKIFELKIPLIKNSNACARNDECINKQIFFFERILGNKFNYGLIISDPILSYIEITQEIKIYNQLSIKKNKCRTCYTPFLHFIEKIRDYLLQTNFIPRYLSIDSKNRSLSEIYSIIFGDFNIYSKKSGLNLVHSEFNEQICISYNIGPYKITISKNLESNEYFYTVSSILDDPNLKNIYQTMMKEIKAKPKDFFNYKQSYKLDFLLRSGKKLLIQLMKQQYGHLSDIEISDISELLIFELTNLNSLMAPLLDPAIEELFYDNPNPKSFIYLDHSQFGRCRTNISLTPSEIESLKTRMRIEAEHRLDEIQPFLKTEIITEYFHIRVSIQIYPLSVDGFSMSIRKLHKKTLTLLDLIKNNTISIEAASYLIYSLIHGRCILVIGEPYSGKTTLINSLDTIGKSNWRKIYIEDVIESIDQTAFEVHQVRFQVDSNLSNPENYSTKSYQVKECLHRTPDVIFIGELIHSKSVESFFFLLKVGLRRCLATAHGESPELMIDRFIFDDKIPPSLIGNLDIVVQMNRIDFGGRSIRRVTRITEIKKKTHTEFNKISNILQDASITFIDVFLRDPERDQLIGSFKSLNELYERSAIIKEINSLRGEYVSKTSFHNEIDQIGTTLNELLKNETYELGKIIQKFHRFWNDLDCNKIPN